ncbi:VOC family protein [Natronomonas sp. EA1]|uniref:VOC family protein n=1 Tax=Natronomonas sp. EA1 TaxID=3421655 RepID=UPI003EBAC986
MSSSLPAECHIGRVALVVNDLDDLTAFYRDVVGLHVLAREEGRATLGVGDTPLLLLREDADAPARPSTAAGLFHTAFLVPSRAALGDALERVRDRWRLGGASDHLVSEAIYLTDPEGNGIEIYRDRPREAWTETEGGIAIDTLPLDLDAVATEAAGEEAMPEGTTVGHVHLEVSDIEATRAFYVDALGLELQATYGDSALFLAAGGYHHHLGANVWHHRSRPPEGRGLAWFEVVLPDEASLEATAERLRAAGHAVTSAGEGLDVVDPSGITLRLRS